MMPFTVEEFRDLIRLLEERPEWRADLRRLLLTDELLELPSIVRELAEKVDALAEEHRALVAQMKELAEKVDALVTWQREEAGRREGERYEREMLRRATTLFRGGSGGSSEEFQVRERLSRWLSPLLERDRLLDGEEDPFLADLIWWKGEKVAVVEVSLKVNGRDVLCAFRRAETLRSVGVDALPVVIGRDWASVEARELAKDKGVEWIVEEVYSDGVIAFRRLPLKR